jgi:hypothetical protein
VENERQIPDDSPTHAPHPADEPAETTGAEAATTPDMEAESPEAGAAPPGYDWPTHGGYLGCLLGLLPGCLIASFFSTTFVAVLNKAQIVPPAAAGALVVVLFIACVIGFGRVGWVLGRRYYRRYAGSEATWGEDDAAPAVASSGDGEPG